MRRNTPERIAILLCVGMLAMALHARSQLSQRIDKLEQRNTWTDPRPKRAYEELGRTAARSRHDIIAAHERISALEWQLFVVIKTCPGQAKPPAPPWPVLQPKWSEPVRLPTWESFVLRHVRSEGK